MFSLSGLITIIEILVGELILIYSFPKQKKFWLRFLLSTALCIAICSFIPEKVSVTNEIVSALYTFFRYVGFFALSVLVMHISYRAPFSSIISVCSVGYAIQHAASRIVIILVILCPAMTHFGLGAPYDAIIMQLIVFSIVYLLAYFVFGKLIEKREMYKDNNSVFNIVSMIMVAVCIGFSRFSPNLGVLFYTVALCIFALFIQIELHRLVSLREENEAIKKHIEETAKHYELSKENIDLINIKCHDLKYKLMSFNKVVPQEEINSMLECVDFYDKTFHTGNDAIDTILADKRLQYQNKEIEFTFMGDGKELSFMSVSDIYSLFGNALDNAFEAVKDIEDKDKRIITFTIEKRGELVVATISNYFEGQMEIKDGIPVTTKKTDKGYHGFGIKSIKSIVEKYQGEFNINITDVSFTLSLGFMTK